jgi:hypothetical protein
MRFAFKRGQAAVETAITMPLLVFMILGTLQLFLLLQGRLFAEHAAYAAVRSGVVNHGSCDSMNDAALVALLPNVVTFLGGGTAGATPAEKLAQAFKSRVQLTNPHGNKYFSALDANNDGFIFEIDRLSPRVGSAPDRVKPESEHDFDTPGQGYVLEARITYWYAMKIPFANWVMGTMFKAYFSLGDFVGVNPIIPTKKNANWKGVSTFSTSGMGAEFLRRFNAKQYVFPVTGSYSMRMMTPPRLENFQNSRCPP